MTVRFSKLANTMKSNFTSYYLLGIASHQFKLIYSNLNFSHFCLQMKSKTSVAY